GPCRGSPSNTSKNSASLGDVESSTALLFARADFAGVAAPYGAAFAGWAAFVEIAYVLHCVVYVVGTVKQFQVFGADVAVLAAHDLFHPVEQTLPELHPEQYTRNAPDLQRLYKRQHF